MNYFAHSPPPSAIRRHWNWNGGGICDGSSCGSMISIGVAANPDHLRSGETLGGCVCLALAFTVSGWGWLEGGNAVQISNFILQPIDGLMDFACNFLECLLTPLNPLYLCLDLLDFTM